MELTQRPLADGWAPPNAWPTPALYVPSDPLFWRAFVLFRVPASTSRTALPLPTLFQSAMRPKSVELISVQRRIIVQ